MNMITIDVEPDRGIWRVTLDGTWLGNFRQPFFGAARELLGRGYPADARLELRHASGTIGLRSTIGEAAKWTADDRKMAFRPYEPFSRPRVGPKSGQVEVEPSPMAGEGEKALGDEMAMP